jgi:hypothetical protein
LVYTQEVSQIRHILPSNALRLSLKDTNLSILVLASTALLADMIIFSFFDVLVESLASSWGIMLFILPLTVIYGTGQYLLGFEMQVSKDLKKKSDIAVTNGMVVVVQYAVSVILILAVLQILLGSYFSARLIIPATFVSYIPATIIMGILGYSL